MTAPAVVSDAYTDAIAQARRRGYRLGRLAQELLIAAFREAANRIEFDLQASDNPLTRARAESLRQQLDGILRELERTTGQTTNRAVQRTIQDVVRIHERVVADLFERYTGDVPRETLDALGRVNVRAAAVLAARSEIGGGAAGFRTLMKYHREQAAPDLDRLIQSAVSRGVSTRRLTRDVADLLANGVADLEGYGLAPRDTSKLGELQYDAKRIATTEALGALRESQTLAMAETSVVEAVKYQLSGAHRITDECDLLAEADWYGLGGGFFPPSRFPALVHPFCGCTQGEVRLLHPSKWSGSRPAAPGLAIAVEEMDLATVVSGTGSWSELRANRAVTALRRSLLDPIGRRARRAA